MGDDPKLALVAGAIVFGTGLGWLLMVGADPLGLASICRDGFASAGWDFGAFAGLSLQWQVMLMTMMLPCIAPAIIGVARAERHRYGTLTAAMAFALAYGAVMLVAAAVAAVSGMAEMALVALLALAAAVGIDRLRRPRRPATHATDPFRAGLQHGLSGLPAAALMIGLQSVFGLDNLPAMVAMAVAMVLASHSWHVARTPDPAVRS